MKTGERCAEYLGCVPAIVLAGVAEGYKGAWDTQKQSGPGAARAMGLSPAAGRGVCVCGGGWRSASRTHACTAGAALSPKDPYPRGSCYAVKVARLERSRGLA